MMVPARLALKDLIYAQKTVFACRKEEDGRFLAGIYECGEPLVTFKFDGIKAVERITLKGFEYILEVELANEDPRYYDVIVNVLGEDGKTPVYSQPLPDYSNPESYYNPFFKETEWTVSYEVNSRNQVIVSCPTAINRAQAEAKAKRIIEEGGSEKVTNITAMNPISSANL